MENSLEEASEMCRGIESQQSLVSALCKFVSAVKNMENAVMIPSKLRDMEIEEKDLAVLEQNNNHSNLPKLPAGSDLYSFYSMLNSVKDEIVSGSGHKDNQESNDSCEIEDNSEPEDTSMQTAAAFRHHLKGIFGILNQLTETANFLKSRYEGEVRQTSSNVSSFAM